MQNEPSKKLQDVHTLYFTLKCILHQLHIKIKNKKENRNIITKQTVLLSSKAVLHHTAIPLETKQG